MTASQPRPTYRALVSDFADEAAAWLRDKAGPIGVAEPTIAGNLNANAAADMRILLGEAVRRAGAGEVYCQPCDAVIAARSGARAILQAHFEEARGTLALTLRLVDGRGQLLDLTRIEGNADRAALLRDDARALSSSERIAELQQKRPLKTSFGNAALVGVLLVPFAVSGVVNGLQTTFNGTINGLMFAYRFYEQFGDEKSFMFGIQAQGFMDPQFQNSLPQGLFEPGFSLPAAGGMFSAVFGYTFAWADLRLPRLRVGGQGGVFLGGSLGNSFIAGGLLEVLLRFRLGLSLGLLYLGDAKTTIDPIELKLGGLTWMFAGSFNWD